MLPTKDELKTWVHFTPDEGMAIQQACARPGVEVHCPHCGSLLFMIGHWAHGGSLCCVVCHHQTAMTELPTDLAWAGRWPSVTR